MSDVDGAVVCALLIEQNYVGVRAGYEGGQGLTGRKRREQQEAM